MPTSIHLPKHLLRALARRAKELGVSRNRVVVQALERELMRNTEWSPGFLEKFGPLAPADAKAVDEMVAAIRARRSSKRPIKL